MRDIKDLPAVIVALVNASKGKRARLSWGGQGYFGALVMCFISRSFGAKAASGTSSDSDSDDGNSQRRFRGMPWLRHMDFGQHSQKKIDGQAEADVLVALLSLDRNRKLVREFVDAAIKENDPERLCVMCAAALQVQRADTNPQVGLVVFFFFFFSRYFKNAVYSAWTIVRSNCKCPAHNKVFFITH